MPEYNEVTGRNRPTLAIKILAWVREHDQLTLVRITKVQGQTIYFYRQGKRTPGFTTRDIYEWKQNDGKKTVIFKP